MGGDVDVLLVPTLVVVLVAVVVAGVIVVDVGASTTAGSVGKGRGCSFLHAAIARITITHDRVMARA